MECLYLYISVFEQKYGQKLREMVLAPFRKWNSFNNSRKDGKFDIDLVDDTPDLRIGKCFSVIYFYIKTLQYPMKPNINQ